MIASMPVVCRFRGILVTINPDDHPPPHFHARYGGAKASIRINEPAVIAGWLPPRQLREVTDWAGARQDELRAAWAQMEADEIPGQILPPA